MTDRGEKVKVKQERKRDWMKEPVFTITRARRNYICRGKDCWNTIAVGELHGSFLSEHFCLNCLELG